MARDRRYRWYIIELVDTTWKPCKYIYRGITIAERRIAGTKLSGVEAENFILETCVEDCDLSKIPIGVAEVLLGQIYKLSGLTEEGFPWMEADAWLRDRETVLDAVAICMIPGLTFDELDNCDPFHRAKYGLLGKVLFESLYDKPVSEAFLFTDPDQPEELDVSKIPLPNPLNLAPGATLREEDSFTFKRKRKSS